MSNRQRAIIFGEEADAYELARPTYPEAAIAHIEGLVEARRAAEVGAGTGKATTDLARPGLQLTCLEPSPEMAAILEAKHLPGVEVVISAFEDWNGAEGSLDLVYAAQSWHWIDPDQGYSAARRLLRPGGVLALMWNVPLDRYRLFDRVYEANAPGLLAEHDERIRKRDSVKWMDDMVAAGFEEVRRFRHEWSESLQAPEVRALYSTYSDHLMLPEKQRTRLLDELAAEVERHGGDLELHYRTNVFSGMAPGHG